MDKNIAYESGETLYQKVKQEILELLAELPLNSRIPTRNDMAERFAVARTTIDRAVSELIGEGYLYSKVGSGTYIVSHNPVTAPSSGTLSLWGILLPSVTDYSFPELIRGTEDVCSEANVSLVLCNTDNSVAKQERYIEKLLAIGVSGIIAVPTIDDSFVAQKHFADLAANGMSIVFCTRGNESGRIPKIVTNDFCAADMAVTHIIDMGWKKPAFISKKYFQTVEQRYAGYLSSLSKYGIQADERFICLECDPDDGDTVYKRAAEMLAQPDRPDSFFCFNDETAIEVYRAIEDAGLRVGEDVGVVGCDDTSICEELRPSLTSVHQPSYEIGRRAAKLVLQMSGGTPSIQRQVVILEPSLTVRESCGKGKQT